MNKQIKEEKEFIYKEEDKANMQHLKDIMNEDDLYRIKELETIKLCKADNNYNCPIWKSCPHGIDCALYNEDNE